MNKEIGFIGYGNMAKAISKSLADKDFELFAYDPNFSNDFNLKIIATKSANDLVKNASIIFLSIKPQMAEEALKGLCFKDKIIVSIMAGVNINKLKQLCDGSTKIVRVMPNLCARIGKATSAYTAIGLSASELAVVEDILNSFGISRKLDESFFDVITGLTGSSPAYNFKYILNNILVGVKSGLSFEDSRDLVIYTMQSSAELLKNVKDIGEIETLIDNVCSKGGTTIEGINVLNTGGFDSIVQNSLNAAIRRSKELSGELPNVELYTDGACSGNPGKGGWAAIIKTEIVTLELSGFEPHTTNNRMELLGVINGLKGIKEPSNVVVYSDSAYIVNAFNENWIRGWIDRDWKNVKNIDLWKELITLTKTHKVTFSKVKGHSDNELNNRCDYLATNQIKIN